MAKGDMDDFLKTYYRRLHTGSMPYDVLAGLVDSRKKGLLTGHQEEWFNDFLEPDPNTNNKLGYKAKDLPEPNNTDDLTEEGLKNLYIAFNTAISGMKSKFDDYDTVNDKNIRNFVKEWFDEKTIGTPPQPLFAYPKATPECEEGITKIIDLLNKQYPSLKTDIVSEARKDDGTKLFDSVESLDKLLKKCADGKYNTDKSVQSKIQTVAYALYRIWYNSGQTTPETEAIGKIYRNLSNVYQEDAFSVTKVPSDLTDFKDLYVKDLLDTLYHDKAVREKFKEFDTKKITEKIEKAEGKISWHDPNSANYVKPKIDDTLTPLQQLEKWTTDTYADTIKKYEDLRGGHLFFKAQAKEIFKAIDKEKIKPTDGLNGLLDKADAIKKRISNKTVMEHFDWFVETMNSIKNDIPKAIAGAWNNGAQMNAVITQIILKATDPRNDDPQAMEKAMTAMEIMTAMKYGMMTSKVMDAMKQTDFTIFSDKDLSWNKNDGIKFVTKAFDQSIKAAFLGVGYGVTIVRNKVMMSKRKTNFHDKDNQSGALSQRMREERDRIARDNQKKHDIENLISNKQRELQNQQNILQTLQNSGFDKNTAEQYKEQQDNRAKPFKDAMDDASARKTRYQKDKDQFNEEIINHQQEKDAYDQYTRIINGDDIRELRAEAQQLQDKINNLQNTFNRPLVDPMGNPITDPDIKQAILDRLSNQIADLSLQYSQKQDEINNLTSDPTRITNARTARSQLQPGYNVYINAQNQLQQTEQYYQNAENDYQNAKQQYDNIVNDPTYTDNNNKLSQFKDATASIEEINKIITAKETSLQKWDEEHANKLVVLENYWNFLQGNTKTFAFSLKRAQQKFDVNKQQLLQNYVSQHSLDV